MDAFIIFCAKYLVVAPVGAMLAYVHREGLAVAKKVALELAVALPLVYVAARIVGLFFGQEQPFVAYGFEPLLPHAVDNSFPSDHMAFMSVFATVAYLRHRYLGLSLWVMAAAAGVARVAAGLHYPADLVAAACLAVAAVFAARALLAAYTKVA